jgi:type I restriction enzyme M protein
MAKVVGVGGAKNNSQTIHDPTCGSGSLLLKAHDEAKSRTGYDLALYGQEMDNATKALRKRSQSCDRSFPQKRDRHLALKRL